MSNTIDFPTLTVIVGLFVSGCSIAAFVLGRKKEATTEGKRCGILETDIKNISNQIGEMKNSFDRMNIKLDAAEEKRELEYRNMLVSMTELSTNYSSLHSRVDKIEKKLDLNKGGA